MEFLGFLMIYTRKKSECWPKISYSRYRIFSTCFISLINLFLFHAVTWDIRRQDSCVDYFPNQDYESECQLDLDNYIDGKIFPKHNKDES
jgi:hypothetical protein